MPRCGSSGLPGRRRGPLPASRFSARSQTGSSPLRERGAKAVSLLGVRATVPWLLPGVKSTSYAVNMAAEAEAKRRGVDEAIFVDADGIVLEGTVTNVWWRKGSTLFTPSLDLGILAGVTRATLIELAPACGLRRRGGRVPARAICSTPTRRSRRRRCARSCRSSRSTAARSGAGRRRTTLQAALREPRS